MFLVTWSWYRSHGSGCLQRKTNKGGDHGCGTGIYCHFSFELNWFSRLLKPDGWLLKFVSVRLKAMCISSFSKIKYQKLWRILLCTLEMVITMVIYSIESSKVSWYKPDVHSERGLAVNQSGVENSKMKLSLIWRSVHFNHFKLVVYKYFSIKSRSWCPWQMLVLIQMVPSFSLLSAPVLGSIIRYVIFK